MATASILLPIPAHWADPTNPPGLSYTAANRPYLTFDGTTDELCGWSFRMPVDYVSGLTIKVQYSMDTATTNNVAIRTEVQATADGENVATTLPYVSEGRTQLQGLMLQATCSSGRLLSNTRRPKQWLLTYLRRVLSITTDLHRCRVMCSRSRHGCTLLT